jgi:hypothetical protein
VPPPRPESIREEARRRGVSLYQVRAERGEREHLTRRTAVGHGPLPVKIARAVEQQRRGHPRALPVATQEKYRREIAAYESRRYGRLVTAKARPRSFTSLADAKEWVRMNGLTDVVEAYGEIKEENGQWVVYLLR